MTHNHKWTLHAKNRIIHNHFYPIEFPPDGALSSVYSSVCLYIPTSVRKNFLFQIIYLFFWDHHISNSWRFFGFLYKWFFSLLHLIDQFSNIKGITLGALQVIWFMLAWFCLQILNLHNDTRRPSFRFSKKSLC